MIINNTPVRTSKNFGINNIDLKLFEMPRKIDEFNNMTIRGDVQEFKITDEVSPRPLVYGLGEELEAQVYESSNRNIKIEVSKEKKEISLHLDINTEICSIMEYFEIFTQRTLYCSKACKVLKCSFGLYINGDKFL